jgi:hypothetical protein
MSRHYYRQHYGPHRPSSVPMYFKVSFVLAVLTLIGLIITR